jgi:hypothetical protein
MTNSRSRIKQLCQTAEEPLCRLLNRPAGAMRLSSDKTHWVFSSSLVGLGLTSEQCFLCSRTGSRLSTLFGRVVIHFSARIKNKPEI